MINGYDVRWLPVVEGLVGKPFQWGARGPDAYDCWGLVTAALQGVGLPVPPDLMKAEDGVKDTTRTLESEIATPLWVRQGTPQPGDVVALSTHRLIHHLGLWTPWGVLHTLERCGAVVNQLTQLRMMGYSRIEFYRWAG
jgi:cell wall-associated NlpC family hydrolase